MSEVHSQPDDPLHKLHKMSRTAGLASSDYVAVNAASVAALILGLASALIVFDEVFLAVPAAGIVFGFIALRQIRNSNGTQTGRGLAWTGLAATVLFLALPGSKLLLQKIRHNQDSEQIAALVAEFGKDIGARNYDAAYQRMSDRFQGRIDRAEFGSRFDSLQDAPLYGPVQQMQWNRLIRFDVDVRSGAPVASTFVLVTLKNEGDRGDRQMMNFRKVDGKWMIEDIPTIFPTPVALVGAPKPLQRSGPATQPVP